MHIYLDYMCTPRYSELTMMQATETLTEAKSTEQLLAGQDGCAECGGSLEDGYEERNHGTDAETGYQDVWLVCRACCDEIHMEPISERVYIPDALELAKAQIEDEDLF